MPAQESASAPQKQQRRRRHGHFLGLPSPVPLSFKRGDMPIDWDTPRRLQAFAATGSLVHHRSRSQVASDQRSQPITRTYFNRKRTCRETIFLVSDRHSIGIVDFGLSDRYPIARRGLTQTLTISGALAVPICAQPKTPSTKDT